MANRQLVLNKGSQTYVFRYDSGSEDMLLESLVAQADNNSTNFDWFDAAVLSFKLTQSLITEADGLLSDKILHIVEPFRTEF